MLENTSMAFSLVLFKMPQNQIWLALKGDKNLFGNCDSGYKFGSQNTIRELADLRPWRRWKATGCVG
jgi:hypothetical protein